MRRTKRWTAWSTKEGRSFDEGFPSYAGVRFGVTRHDMQKRWDEGVMGWLRVGEHAEWCRCMLLELDLHDKLSLVLAGLQ